MAKTVFTGHHKHMVEKLVAARKKAGLKQSELGALLGKDQTFISLIERSQRRLDVLEFYAYARAIGINPIDLFSDVISNLPDKIEI